MDMTNVFDKLKALQDILAEKYEIESKIDNAPKDLGRYEQLLDRMKEEYININTAYEESKTRISQLKFELDEAVAARERGEEGVNRDFWRNTWNKSCFRISAFKRTVTFSLTSMRWKPLQTPLAE